MQACDPDPRQPDRGARPSARIRAGQVRRLKHAQVSRRAQAMKVSSASDPAGHCWFQSPFHSAGGLPGRPSPVGQAGRSTRPRFDFFEAAIRSARRGAGPRPGAMMARSGAPPRYRLAGLQAARG